MISHWIHQAKLAQWLAPDPNYKGKPEDADNVWSDLLQIVAPDPNYTSKNSTTIVPPPSLPVDSSSSNTARSSVFFSPTTRFNDHPGKERLQQDAQEVQMPAQKITTSPYYSSYVNSPQYNTGSSRQHSLVLSEEGKFVNATAGTAGVMSPFKKKTPRKTPIIHDPVADVPIEIKECIKRVADTRRLTGDRRKDIATQFTRVTTQLAPKAQHALRQRILEDPSLLTRRSYRQVINMLQCPDGSTLFMVAIYEKRLETVQLIWETSKTIGMPHATYQLQCTNMVGETAWHYAAQTANDEILLYVTSLYHETFGEEYEPPMDIFGFTPLATGMTNVLAKSSAEKLLYDDRDPSVVGTPRPAMERTLVAANATVGMAELNGQRCQMEDYIMADTIDDKDGSSVVLLVAIADGHGDDSEVAQFVSNGFIGALKLLPQPIADWEQAATTICSSLDDELRTLVKNKRMFGGAVAIFCAVTLQQIIVANVGDCRAILIQRNKQRQDQSTAPTVQELTDATEKLSLKNADSESLPSCSNINSPHVIALSFDHKPDRPLERTRIEAVPYTIVEVNSWQDKNGETNTIARVKDTKHSTKAPAAFSRSFGDFEYKDNKHLDAASQAIIAIPELTILDRSIDTDDDLFVVLACDGVWDVMTNQMVADFCYQRRTMRPTEIADALVHEALRLEATDNLSAAVIDLREATITSPSPLFQTSKKLFAE